MRKLPLFIFLFPFLLFGCKKEPIKPSSREHTLRFLVTASGGEALTVFGRVYAKDSINFTSKKLQWDTTYVITLGRQDYCNLDIAAISNPNNPLPVAPMVEAKAFIDDQLITEQTGASGVGLDIYYDNYIPY